MEELIKQAFLHVDVIGPHVQQGHYDLLGPDQEIILPQVWERVVEPDWSITMHMWPIDQRPPPVMGPRPMDPRMQFRPGMGRTAGPPPGAIPVPPMHGRHAGAPGHAPPRVINVGPDKGKKKSSKNNGILQGIFGSKPPKK
jgi:hypothetical protein